MARRAKRRTRTLGLPVSSADPLRAPRPPRKPVAGRRPMYSASFYADLGPAPTEPDLVRARLYWLRIIEVTDREDACWTRNERISLRRLERVWRRRMLGEDRRWMLVGTRAGRLEPALEEAVRPAAAGWGEQFKIVRPAEHGKTTEGEG